MLTTKQKLAFTIAKLDATIIEQVTCILDSPPVKKLESLWVELALLCEAKKNNPNISIKLFNITLEELEKDINTSHDLEDTKLFKHIYEEELGMAGGEPFSLLLINESFNLQKIPQVSTLSRLSELAAYALAPVITNASPETFSHDNFNEIDDFQAELKTASLDAWHRLRKTSQSRFLNITVPTGELSFQTLFLNKHYERSITVHTSTLLALRTIDSFNVTSWFSEVLGFFAPQDYLATPLLPFYNKTLRLNTTVFLKQTDERALTAYGLIPLMQAQENAEFYFANLYASYVTDELASLLLEHLLAACRFGHHIKLLARQKIGSFADESGCEQWIANWLNTYTAKIHDQSLRYHYPLKAHQVKLSKIPGKIGYYRCQILLEPHMKFENMNAQIILHSEIMKPNK